MTDNIRNLLLNPQAWKEAMRQDPGQKIIVVMSLDEWNTVYKFIRKWECENGIVARSNRR